MSFDFISPEDLSGGAWVIIALLSFPGSLLLVMFIGGTYNGGNYVLDVLVAITITIILVVGLFGFCYSLYACSVIPGHPDIMPPPPRWPP